MEDTREFLKEAKRNVPDLDYQHEQELRRALLNSDFYHENILVRWQKRFGVEIVTFRFISYSLLSGVILSFVFQFSIVKLTLSDYTNTSSSVEISRIPPKAALEDLYKRGRIEYSGETRLGARVYLLKADDKSIVTLYDRSPYLINVAHAE